MENISWFLLILIVGGNAQISCTPQAQSQSSVTCDNTCDTCNINCDSDDSCKETTIRSGAKITNIYCSGIKSCELAKIYIGNRDVNSEYYRSEYDSFQVTCPQDGSCYNFLLTVDGSFISGGTTDITTIGGADQAKEGEININLDENQPYTLICDPNSSTACLDLEAVCTGGQCACQGRCNDILSIQTPTPTIGTGTTKEPTNIPSIAPIMNPTEIPTTNTGTTKTPTNNPSVNTNNISPTSAPIEVRTVNPTNNPSSNLSKTPSITPTKTPSREPTTTGGTFSPSISPILRPSISPSLNTINPTKLPTTISPTTISPTISPTPNPTNDNREIVDASDTTDNDEFKKHRRMIVGAILALTCCYIFICFVFKQGVRKKLQINWTMTTHTEPLLTDQSSWNEQKRINKHLFASSVNHSFKEDNLIETNLTARGETPGITAINMTETNSHNKNNTTVNDESKLVEGDIETNPLNSYTKNEAILQSPNTDYTNTFKNGNRVSKVTNITAINSETTYISQSSLNSLNTIQSNDNNNSHNNNDT